MDLILKKKSIESNFSCLLILFLKSNYYQSKYIFAFQRRDIFFEVTNINDLLNLTRLILIFEKS